MNKKLNLCFTKYVEFFNNIQSKVSYLAFYVLFNVNCLKSKVEVTLDSNKNADATRNLNLFCTINLSYSCIMNFRLKPLTQNHTKELKCTFYYKKI